MSFLGKEYKYVSNENLEAFLKSIGITGERAQKLQSQDVPKKLVKNSDGSYTIYSITREVNFKSGEEFERSYETLKAKVTIIVDGNTVTETQKFDEAMIVTIKKEFTDTELVETLTNTGWDGTEKVYYKA